MSVITLDQFIPPYLSGTMNNKDILTALFITTNDGNKILDFIAKMQNNLNQSENSPNRREAVNYITWGNNSNIISISGYKNMRNFLREMYSPSLNSETFVKICVLSQMLFQYYNKAIFQLQNNKLNLPSTKKFHLNVINKRAYLKSQDTIDSFVGQFYLFKNITF